jgi:hypothetical protein
MGPLSLNEKLLPIPLGLAALARREIDPPHPGVGGAISLRRTPGHQRLREKPEGTGSASHASISNA